MVVMHAWRGTRIVNRVFQGVLDMHWVEAAAPQAGMRDLAHSAMNLQSDIAPVCAEFEHVLHCWHTQALQCFRSHFATSNRVDPTSTQTMVTTPVTCKSVLDKKWTHYHAFRKPATVSIPNVFLAWMHCTKFNLCHRQHARLVRVNKTHKRWVKSRAIFVLIRKQIHSHSTQKTFRIPGEKKKLQEILLQSSQLFAGFLEEPHV